MIRQKIAAGILVGGSALLIAGAISPSFASMLGSSHDRHQVRHEYVYAFEDRDEMRHQIRDEIRNNIRNEIRNEIRSRRSHEQRAMAEAVAADLAGREFIGSYKFGGNGSVLGKFDWDVNATLTLNDDNTYALDLDMNMNGEREQEHDSGRYRIEGDRVIMYSHDGTEPEHTLRLEGDRLQFEDFGGTEKLLLRAIGVRDLAFTRITP